eukprot:GHRQ01025398.1.p1 GENE.GHRQ01025398.1~~GHRQ01025398.1.p1  ORF type:complete len:216 (+),score=52.33 GHRQ01025398.1:516-1163(+)
MTEHHGEDGLTPDASILCITRVRAQPLQGDALYMAAQVASNEANFELELLVLHTQQLQLHNTRHKQPLVQLRCCASSSPTAMSCKQLAAHQLAQLRPHTQQMVQCSLADRWGSLPHCLCYEKSRAQHTTGATTVHRYSASQNHLDPSFTHMLTQPLSSRHMSAASVLSCQLVNSMAMYIDASAKMRWNMSGRYGSSCLSSSPVPKMWEVPSVSVL